MNDLRAPAPATLPPASARPRARRGPPAVRDLIRGLAVCALAVCALAGCGTESSDAPEVATNVVATPGDGRVTLSWTGVDGAQYWIFYAPGTDVSFPGSTSAPGYRSDIDSTNPRAITGLTNGTAYAFRVGSAGSDLQVGEQSAVVTASPRPAGGTWVTGTQLGSGSMNGTACNGQGLYAAVGAGGTVWTSPDALTWTARTSGTTANLRAIAWGSGRFVAVGDAGTVVTSTDGTTWETRASGVTSALNGVTAYGNNFVAVGAGGVSLTGSSDATIWNLAASGTTTTLNGVTNANGRLVAVGSAGTLVTSTDANTWTSVSLPVAADLYAAGFGLNVFVATGAAGTVLWSGDGLAWSAGSAPTTAALNGVAAISQFAAVGDGGTVLLSTDGKAWTPASSGTTNRLAALCAGDARFSAVGANGTSLSSQ